MTEWSDVVRALLGSWPSVVGSWGKEAIAAYISELQARGVSADAAMTAIRTADGGFPPSAPYLAGLARADAMRPTAAEALRLIYGSGGALMARSAPGRYDNEAAMLGARDEAARQRAYDIHPLLGAFVDSYGVRELRMLEVNDPDYGAVRRRELTEAWEEFCERNAHRDRAALAAGRTRDLARGPRRLDPLSAFGRIDQPSQEART